MELAVLLGLGADALVLYRAMAWLGQAEPRTDPAAAGAATEPAAVDGAQKGAVAAVQSKTSRGPTPIYRWRGLKDKIEKSLWVERQDLFNSLSMVFFDTTSLYFEGAGGQRCRSDKLSRLCSDKLIHPGSALGRGFLFPSSGRGGRVLAEGRSDAKENPRLTCSTLTCRLGKTGTYLSALAS